MGKFNVGDKVKCNDNNCGFDIGDEVVIDKVSDGQDIAAVTGCGQKCRWVYTRYFDLVEEAPSKDVCKMTKKIVYSVFILDKKTGKVTKDVKVTADNEQQAILKTFGVDAENTYIKITELGNYEEDKPIKAVIEEKPKK